MPNPPQRLYKIFSRQELEGASQDGWRFEAASLDLSEMVMSTIVQIGIGDVDAADPRPDADLADDELRARYDGENESFSVAAAAHNREVHLAAVEEQGYPLADDARHSKRERPEPIPPSTDPVLSLADRIARGEQVDPESVPIDAEASERLKSRKKKETAEPIPPKEPSEADRVAMGGQVDPENYPLAKKE